MVKKKSASSIISSANLPKHLQEALVEAFERVEEGYEVPECTCKCKKCTMFQEEK